MAQINSGLSISTKVGLLSGLTGLVIIAVYLLFTITVFNQTSSEFYQEKALSIATSIDAGVSLDTFKDPVKIQNIVNKSTFINPDITLININLLNEQGQLVTVASNRSDLIGLAPEADNTQSFTSGTVLQSSVTSGDHTSGFRIVSPIIMGGQKIGTYDLTLSTLQAQNKLQQRLQTLIGVISLLVVLTSLFLYSFVRRTVLTPLKKLSLAVNEMSEGKDITPLNLLSHDELGHLAAAFNESAAKLADLHHHHLEEKVTTRTAELNESVKKIADQNIASEKTNVAMLNLLEDSKELENELKKEKESVEMKVIERTRELANTKARLDSSIENLPLGFIMTDLHEQLVITNPLAQKLLGSSDAATSLAKLKNLLGSKLNLSTYIQKCGENQQRLTFSDLDSEGRTLQLLFSPILTHDQGERCLGVVILIQDITEAKILERSKDEFFSIASHELRTPLTAIRGNTAMIQEYFAEDLKNPELKDMISDIHESSVRLIHIVNDFLNVSRLEQGKMSYESKIFDVEKIIPNIIKEYEVPGTVKNLTIDFQPSATPLPAVLADSDKVTEILVNLLGNALKFTAKGGIVVSTGVDHDLVKVFISDTGRGISAKQQSLLFHKFQQAGTSLFTRDTAGGTGLGLYISKIMAEGMGGKLELVKSVEDQGTTFCLSLPIAPNQRKLDSTTS